MPNYNSGHIYNTDGIDGGIFYNTDYLVIINVKEVIGFSESIGKALASYVLSDKAFKMYDALAQAICYKLDDKFRLEDDAIYSALFSLTDKLGITEEISALLVLATIHDKQNVVDEVKQFNEILMSEDFSLGYDLSVGALLDVLDKYGLKELSSDLKTLFTLYERENITDKTPKSAVSDFLIGVTDNLDAAYDWLVPFGMKIDWDATNIQIMPEAESTVIEMPGVDGSIVDNTIYKDRLFSIVAFSEDGLSRSEKQELKSKITEILDSTKHQSKKLTVQVSGNSFDVKYDGQAVVSEGPSYVKATIPLRTPPYGYKTFEGELFGSGLVSNEGDASVGVRHTISGPISNPSFTLGENAYKWNGTVPSGSELVIDHQMMTCFLKDKHGKKTNAMAKLNGTFQKIPPNTSIVLTADASLENRIITTWRDKVLW